MQLSFARHRRTPTKPHFYWQGTLIVLPALLLAASGIYALRQDRVLAQHQATEAAKELSVDLSNRLLQEVFAPELLSADGLERWLASPGVAADEPIVRLLTRSLPSVGYFSGDELSYPDRLASAPVAAPLDPEELTPEQRAGWVAMLAWWSNSAGGSSRRSGHVLHEPNPYEVFAALNPPPRFAAIAAMRSAGVKVTEDSTSEALDWLRSAIEHAGDAPGESGYPLRMFAEMQLLPLLPEWERASAANALCSTAIVRTPALAPALLASVVKRVPSAHAWQPVLDAHINARALWREVDANPQAAFVSIAGEDCVPIAVAVSGGRWILAVPYNQLRKAAERLARVNPEHFGVTIALGETLLVESASPEKPLASIERSIALAGGVKLSLDVQVLLEDPNRFFAEQHTRSVRFGALIAVAAAAVLVGFFAAWRAFRRQQQLSEMKTNFVSSVSHELRAPIASVRLMAEELDGGTPPSPDKLQQYHRFIVQECRRLSAVIENVLDFSRREHGHERFEFESTDIVRLTRESVAVMQVYGAEKQLSVRTQVVGEPSPVEADGRALQRLLVNLLDNAIKHSPERGLITVGLEFTPATASLWVEDHGPGIPHEEHARIFERFYRLGAELRRETQGVGLGLSIVRHVATVHGGRVIVRSALGKGSRFTVELPRKRASRANSNGITR